MKTRIFIFSVVLVLFSTSAFAGKFKFDVKVSPPKPSIKASVKFTEPSGNDILDAGEVGKLAITVHNNGKGGAFDVKATINAKKGIKGLRNKVVSFGDIPPGETAEKGLSLTAPLDLTDGKVLIVIEVSEARGFDARPLKVSFKTRSVKPPRLTVEGTSIDDQNGNSLVEPMENVEVTVRVRNAGSGHAMGATADLLLGKNVFISGEGKTHFKIGDLKPGESRDIVFMFYTNKRIKAGENIPISVKLNDQRPRFSATAPLGIEMNARRKTAEGLRPAGRGNPRAWIDGKPQARTRAERLVR